MKRPMNEYIEYSHAKKVIGGSLVFMVSGINIPSSEWKHPFDNLEPWESRLGG